VTGLDYAINRHYDSLQGRFTQVDPIGMGATDLSDPQTLNLYSYCANDPVNHTDPSGLFFKKLFGFIAKAFKWIAVAVTVAVLTIVSGFGVPGAAAILKGLNAVLGAIGSALNTATGGLLGKISGVLNGALGKVLGGIGLPFAEATGVSAAGMGLTALQIAGGVGSVASHLLRRGRGDGRRRGDFQTLTDAAIAAMRRFNIESIRRNREYAGSICEHPDGRLIYTIPNEADGSIGDNDSSTPCPCPTGTTRVGTYHTHAAYDPRYDSEIFSRADRINANNRSLATGNSVPSFVATPTGRIRRFDPAMIRDSTRERVTTLRRRTPIP